MKTIHNPKGLKEGDLVLFEHKECIIEDFINEITVVVRGDFGKSCRVQYYYKNKFNRFFGISSSKIVDSTYNKTIQCSIWSLKPVFK
jgi:hypothetical protein